MAGMDATRCWELLGSARVARFATVAPDGRPSVVPVCFAAIGGVIYHAVDHKPKATRRLARLDHVRAEPRAALLADHYAEDWRALWWVRADGTARVLDEGPQAAHALDLLVERYPQYRERRPDGPVVALDVQRISGWSAATAT
jgi:PPOX class probable F420-dependent enzyme